MMWGLRGSIFTKWVGKAMILIGLGANLDGIYGSPEQCLQACSSLFAEAGVFIKKSSNIWRSAPVPISDQPWYCNAVCAVETKLSPMGLLTALAEIENCSGRTRLIENEARVLDLDLLVYDKDVMNTPALQLPHPRMQERAFVLYPLREVAPDWVHPVLGQSVEVMVNKIGDSQKIECVQDSALLCVSMDKEHV